MMPEVGLAIAPPLESWPSARAGLDGAGQPRGDGTGSNGRLTGRPRPPRGLVDDLQRALAQRLRPLMPMVETPVGVAQLRPGDPELLAVILGAVALAAARCRRRRRRLHAEQPPDVGAGLERPDVDVHRPGI